MYEPGNAVKENQEDVSLEKRSWWNQELGYRLRGVCSDIGGVVGETPPPFLLVLPPSNHIQMNEMIRKHEDVKYD